MDQWAVVACDQYTSQPEYWQAVEQKVGEAPSTLRLIFPEMYLGQADGAQRIESICQAMKDYETKGIFRSFSGLVYVERQVSTGLRRGVTLCLDLEQYDYNKGSTSLVRATEGTILDRIPPRVAIRKGATLELPHIMVLIDDPQDRVIGPLTQAKASLEPLYSFELMMNSGAIAGYGVTDVALEQSVINALAQLAEPAAFRAKYDLPEGLPALLYAMGDGNHSLATAKALWEQRKEQAPDPQAIMDDPARFALVELVNVHDESLIFEPIHRVLFDVKADVVQGMTQRWGDRLQVTAANSLEAMQQSVDSHEGPGHRWGLVRRGQWSVVEVASPTSNLPVGTLQRWLDGWVQGGAAAEIDYVHGTDTVADVGSREGNVGFYLPGMAKGELFRSVILDGALPRKTFSMGEAQDKRFYLECRSIGGV
jgi:hypothetical protein